MSVEEWRQNKTKTKREWKKNHQVATQWANIGSCNFDLFRILLLVLVLISFENMMNILWREYKLIDCLFTSMSNKFWVSSEYKHTKHDTKIHVVLCGAHGVREHTDACTKISLALSCERFFLVKYILCVCVCMNPFGSHQKSSIFYGSILWSVRMFIVKVWLKDWTNEKRSLHASIV